MKGYSLYLYGSNARDENALNSDVDILAVCGSAFDHERNRIELPDGLTPNKLPVDYSIYSLNRLTQMYAEGHLFAWHLYYEAKYLGGDIDRLSGLDRPKPYAAFEQDAQPLLELLMSIHDRVKQSQLNIIYEAGLVYVCVRNIAMAASYFGSCGLSFSAYAPLVISSSKNPFPVSKDEYELFRQARLAGTRGLQAPDIAANELYKAVDCFIGWAQYEINQVRSTCIETAIR